MPLGHVVGQQSADVDTQQLKLKVRGLKLRQDLSERPGAGDTLDEVEAVPVGGALVDEDHLVGQPVGEGLGALGRL